MKYYLQEALRLTELSTVKNQQHAAVCVIGGKIVSSGFNTREDPHTINVDNNRRVSYDFSMHAEVAAIRNLSPKINIKKVKLIVIRKEMKLSKPCEKCADVIRSSGIRNVYYSCDNSLVKFVL